MSAIRPSFREGARLTAGQLNATVKYLRDSLRRFALAPFSPGVAAGLTLTRGSDGDANNTFTVHPGVAVDGRGRLLVLDAPITYTLNSATGDLTQPGVALPVAHFPPSATLFLVRLEYTESGSTPEPECAAGSAFGIVEGVRVVFELADEPGDSVEALLQLFSEGCVDPWSELDAPALSNRSCGVQLGTVAWLGTLPLLADMFHRQGMSARLSIVRNSLGVPSIVLGQLVVGSQRLNAVAFAVPAGGPNVQATHVGAFGREYGAGTYAPFEDRVFLFAGGTPGGTVGAGGSGVAAIPCVLVGPEPVAAPGLPLTIADPSAAALAVARSDAGDPPERVLGISASGEYADPRFPGQRLVPVATSGVVYAAVSAASFGVSPGQDLAMLNATALGAAQIGDRVIARASRGVPDGTVGVIPVWVVHPAYSKA